VQKIRITKEFDFEMAHALWGYDGSCRNIHGHSYRLAVTVTGTAITDGRSPKKGMVMDFGDLKKIIREEIIKDFEHALVISRETPLPEEIKDHEMFGKLLIVDYQPTSENLILDFVARIKRKLPSGIRLHSMRLRETASSYAEWFASDNG
jgi:6-pyruvoyltetrahydropterin/6-carboxytetrahydropterin synthase